MVVARAVVLSEGALGNPLAKTANGLVLHSVSDEIVAVIDSTQVGKDAGDVVAGRPNGIPVVASLADALRFEPERFYLGVANVGGVLPKEFRGPIAEALRADLEVVNGLHTFIDEDAEFAQILAGGTGRVWNVRKPPADLRVADGRAHGLAVPRVVIMGMDCDVGKRLTTVELLKAARARGIDAGFVATGQTGCMLGPDAGAVIDRIPGDFASGQVERMVCTAAEKGRELIFVPGQASIQHPAFAGVSLAILHGCAPNVAILQTIPGRQKRYLFEGSPYDVGDVQTEIDLIETLGRVPVVALSVNGREVDDVPAAAADLSAQTGLPAIDPLYGDVDALLDVILAGLVARGFTDLERFLRARAAVADAPIAKA